MGHLNIRLVIPALSKGLISKYHNRSVLVPKFSTLTFFGKEMIMVSYWRSNCN